MLIKFKAFIIERINRVIKIRNMILFGVLETTIF